LNRQFHILITCHKRCNINPSCAVWVLANHLRRSSDQSIALWLVDLIKFINNDIHFFRRMDSFFKIKFWWNFLVLMPLLFKFINTWHPVCFMRFLIRFMNNSRVKLSHWVVIGTLFLSGSHNLSVVECYLIVFVRLIEVVPWRSFDILVKARSCELDFIGMVVVSVLLARLIYFAV
jgi:hypothetical protein